MSSDWKGLAAELNRVGSKEPPLDGPIASPGSRSTTSPQAVTAETIDSPSGASEGAPPRRRRSKARFVDTHRLVGVYFPHDLDVAFRQAADEAGISNSELVVLAVRAYLRR